MGFQRRSDAELIARVRAGDVASYDELYRRHIDETRRLARLITSSRDEADDIAAEAFTRVLSRLQDGAGPDREFVPYLRTVVRRMAVDRSRAVRRDPAAAGPDVLENVPAPDEPIELAATRTMVRQAFETLPPRWQQALWYTEVEGAPPAALAAVFDSSPNAAAALAYRAREGLRRAHLGLHLAGTAREECKPLLPKIAAHSRGGLDVEERPAVRAHLGECAACRDRYEEMLLLVSDLRGVLASALFGVAASSGAVVSAGASNAGVTGAAAASAGAETTGSAEQRGRPRRAGVRNGVLAGTLVAAAAAVAAFALVVVNTGPSDNVADPPPAAAGTPGDDPGRLSLETTTPSSPAATADSSPTPDPVQEPSSEPTPEPTSDDQAASEPAADGPASEAEETPDQRETPASTSPTRTSTSTATDAGAATTTPPPSPTPDSEDVERLLAAAEDSDPPGWWCEAVSWWPECSGERNGDSDERGQDSRERDGDWREELEGWLSGEGRGWLGDLRVNSRDGACEWLADLPFCSSDERDRHGRDRGR